MIETVTFKNFKSLQDVTLNLDRFTVLVGPNGGGKSSVLQAMHLLSQTGLVRKNSRHDNSDAVHPWARLGRTFHDIPDPRRFTNPLQSSVIELSMHATSGEQLHLKVSVPGADEDEQVPDTAIEFRLHMYGPNGEHLETVVPVTGVAPTPEAQKVLDDPRIRRFGSLAYLHLDANEMTRPSIPTGEKSQMRFNGAGLPSVVAWMKGAAEEEVEKLTQDLARVVSGVKRIRTKKIRMFTRDVEPLSVEGQQVWRAVQKDEKADRFEIEFDHGGSIPADLLSEGTVLALGLLTKLREPGRPKVTLLDDVDRGLHIDAQAKFVGVLRDLLEMDPELQIVCTTHSPYLLDLFEPSEIRVLALDEKRQTRAKKLTDHVEFEKWRYGLQTGELYASLGDAWVSGPEEPAV